MLIMTHINIENIEYAGSLVLIYMVIKVIILSLVEVEMILFTGGDGNDILMSGKVMILYLVVKTMILLLKGSGNQSFNGGADNDTLEIDLDWTTMPAGFVGKIENFLMDG